MDAPYQIWVQLALKKMFKSTDDSLPWTTLFAKYLSVVCVLLDQPNSLSIMSLVSMVIEYQLFKNFPIEMHQGSNLTLA